LICFGYLLDPYNVDFSDSDILKNVASTSLTFDEVIENTNRLGGRWVIAFKTHDELKFFNDATGLKQVYYTNKNHDQYWVSSNSHILAEELGLQVSEEFKTDYLFADKPNDKYFYWWQPAESSAYKELYQLVPNYYLDFSSKTVHRFWPNRKLDNYSLKEIGDEISFQFRNTVQAAHKRFKIAVAVTAGKDSRLLMAVCKDFIDEVYFFINRNVNDNALDFTFPPTFLKELNLLDQYHQVICYPDRRSPMLDEFERINIYKRPTFSSDAIGMYEQYPSDYVAMYAVNSPIIRQLGYFKHKPYTMNVFDWGHNTYMGCRPFVIKYFKKWLNEIKSVTKNYGYTVGELFLIEQKLGSWSSNNRNEWDIAQECFEPFNSRELYHLILSVDEKYRLNEEESLYMKLMNDTNPDLLRFGFPQYELKKKLMKPDTLSMKIKKSFVLFLRRLFAYRVYQWAAASIRKR
jgi:hypothetical protein